MRKWVSSDAHQIAIQFLKEERERQGLSLRAVTDRLGRKHHTYLHKIETGERSLDLIDFIAITRALGLDESEAFRRLAKRLPSDLEI